MRGFVRDYLAHREYEVRTADGWSRDGEDAPIVPWTATRRC